MQKRMSFLFPASNFSKSIMNYQQEPSLTVSTRSKGKKNVIVFDRGGGTFDESLFTFYDGVF